ncbi:TolB family protein [Aromatoleum diolicum]|uniref:Bacterial repeat domain-containing protein n=1 Tax=Aromatoleum diolicum TaxID=75796 RepID=A0ABX1QAU3_9RHOO|nr:PD40 domain-containing protein [Aromatoleum diolicum]NMG74645.1 hypothetical protein [Aromatoleum diolicum]
MKHEIPGLSLNTQPIRTKGLCRSTLLGVLFVALLFGLAQSVAAQLTSANGKIAYVECGSSTHPWFSPQCDIWIMNPDGTEPTNVTNTPDLNEINPAWSADGTKVAYIEGWNGVNYLKMVDLGIDGTGRAITTITEEYSYQFGPTWSPGGTQIALVRQVPGVVFSIQFDIIVMNVDGSGEINITNSDVDEMDPAWSPDGSRIAFASVRPEHYLDPITGTPTTGGQWEIVTVNPDGSGEQIVSAGDTGTPRAQYLEEDRSPAWSPDSSMIVFMSQAQIPSCCGNWQIWAVNRDGTSITNLTDDETVNDGSPSWSPDGTQIVFSRATGSGGFDLYTMPTPSTLSLTAATLSFATTVQAAASATRLAMNASDADWGRDPNSAPTTGSYALFVSVSLNGKGAGGTVTSTPAGIKCGRDCSAIYPTDTWVTLSATPKKGSQFSGWSGACGSAAGSVCSVLMNDAKTVRADFTRNK